MGSLLTQDKVLEYIILFKRENDGNSPSYREIMRGVCLSSTSYVNFLLQALEKRGLIKRDGCKRIMVVGGSWSINGEINGRRSEALQV